MELLSVPRSSYSIFTERRILNPAFRDTAYLMTLDDLLAPTIMDLSTWSSVVLEIPTMFFCHRVRHVEAFLSFGVLTVTFVLRYHRLLSGNTDAIQGIYLIILTCRPISNRIQLQGASNIAEHSSSPAYPGHDSSGGSFAIPPSSCKKHSQTNVAGSRDFPVNFLFRMLT